MLTGTWPQTESSDTPWARLPAVSHSYATSSTHTWFIHFCCVLKWKCTYILVFARWTSCCWQWPKGCHNALYDGSSLLGWLSWVITYDLLILFLHSQMHSQMWELANPIAVNNKKSSKVGYNICKKGYVYMCFIPIVVHCMPKWFILLLHTKV